MIKNILLTLLLSLFTLLLTAQGLLEISSLGDLSAANIESEIGEPVDNGVRTYKILYTALDWNEKLDTLSGLLVIPDLPGSAHPIVVYQHGTTNGPNDAPSDRRSGYDEGLAYGGSGFAALAPDYFGLGDSDGFHPYVHAESEALAGVYALIAGREAMDQMGDLYTDQLFISGYSQGGHGAMALHQMLQEEWSAEYPVTASAPMSGPYSILEVMGGLILSDDTYFFSGYLPYTILSYETVYGNIFDELEDVFKPQYAADIQKFYDGTIPLSDLTFDLSFRLLAETGNVIPKFMLQDTFLQNFIENNDHPLKVAMRDNNTFHWVPESPMRLYYCNADDQVPFMNSILAADSMTIAGAEDVMAVQIAENLDHVECAPPAILESIEFFRGFLPTSVVGQDPYPELRVYPNPANQEVRFEQSQTGGLTTYQIFDMSGRQTATGNTRSNVINVSNLQEGVYLLLLKTDDRAYRSNLIIAR